MATLGNYITRQLSSGPEYECAFCYKTCRSLRALEEHCKYTSSHPWCARCRRAFRNQHAITQHERASPHHHICRVCSFDYQYRKSLREHISDVHAECSFCNAYFEDEYDLRQHVDDEHYECPSCPETFATMTELKIHKEEEHFDCRYCSDSFWTAYSLSCHKEEEHHWCSLCDIRFRDENAIRMHDLTHRPKNLHCYSCYTRKFACFSAMLIHMEAGTQCTDDVNEDRIKRLAFRPRMRWRYTTSWDAVFPFRCPNCDNVFSKLSGLFQHAERVPGCDRYMKGSECLGSLQKYIEKLV